MKIRVLIFAALALAWVAPVCAETVSYDGRDMILHVPAHLPPAGSRALVVVLHGGMGNADRIASMRSESPMNMDAVADKYGFVVAYLNGTPVTRFLSGARKGWNAGLCCGQSAEKNIDDVGYIGGAVRWLGKQYGIDPRRVYGIGHSNGAMMTQRVMCEAGIYTKGVSLSGALELKTESCPGAKGRAILAIHGENDENVPVEGGSGKGKSRKNYKNSQEYSQKVFEDSGATYTLQVYPGAEHKLDTIDEAIQKAEGVTLAEKAARFFGLDK